MASWVEEIVTSLLAGSRGIVHSREQSTSTRVVTWLIVNVPPEWIVFFCAIGFLWCLFFVGGSAWATSNALVQFLFRIIVSVIRRILPSFFTTTSTSQGGQWTLDHSSEVIVVGRHPTRQRQESNALPSSSAPAIVDAQDAVVRRCTRSQGRTE